MKFWFLIVLGLVLSQQLINCDENVDTSGEDVELDNESTVPPKKLVFEVPKALDNYFLMYFTDSSDLTSKWTVSETKKDGVEETLAKYDGVWSVEVPQSSAIENDYSLVLKTKARHAAISSKLSKSFDFRNSKQLVIQYEVKFQNGQDCGGAYIKLLSDNSDLDLKKFHDKTLYTIMFGPDKCGNDNKLHFIFQHKNPISGKYEEKHAKKPNGDLDRYFSDKKSHLYTLVLNSDNTFEVYVDQTLVNSGSLLKDFDPTVNPPKDVDDPTDIKPENWDERAKISDPVATKPEDWDENAPEYIEDSQATQPEGWLVDEPLTVPDDSAEKPKDWDNDMDGEWEPPRIDNPKCKSAPGCGTWTPPKIKNPAYKGKWAAPLIDNPAYKGIWSPKKVPNPDYFEDNEPYQGLASIGAVGLELWSMSDEIAFDNFLITGSKKDADQFASETWAIKKDAERKADPNAQSVVDAIREATSERPWLWIVIILVIGLPIVLLVVYCCRSGSSSSSPYQRRMQEDMSSSAHKKDDDIADEEDDVEEDVDASVTDENVKSNDVSSHGDVKKSQLEESEEESDEPVQQNGKADGDKSSSESNEASNPTEEQTARKRRARKV